LWFFKKVLKIKKFLEDEKMFQEISYYLIFGKPLIMYIGLISIAMFLTVATIGYLIFTGRTKIKITTHRNLAITAITIALIHGFFGVMLYF
jgi:hypothetical protein